MSTTSIRLSLALAASLAALIQGCADPAGDTDIDDLDAEEEDAAESAQAVSYGGTLVLHDEKKLSTLFGASGDYEASGVQVLGSDLYVVFDNKDKIGKVPVSLAGTAVYTAGTLSSSTEQYEGITFDSYGTQHFYLVQEVSPGMVVQLDGAGTSQGEEYQSTGVSFGDSNKGFEGVAWLRRNNTDYLLALCEAGDCGTQTGTEYPGRIRILAQSGSSWVSQGYMRICTDSSCTSGPFSDYSDIALRPMPDGSVKVAVTSQESKALWVGTLSASSWSLSGGTVYSFPGSSYCNVEGVTFLSNTRFAMVSDMTSSGGGCNDKDESVHIFDLP